MARGARSNSVDCSVNNDAHTGKLTNFASANANATATPSHRARSSQCRSGEGQHSHLIQVESNGGVNNNSVQLFATLTQLGTSFSNVRSSQEVGFSATRGSSNTFVQCIARQCRAEQASKLREQTCAVQLVDGISQLVADVKHRVFTSGQHCNVIHCIRKTAMADGCNLSSGANLLRSQVASRAGAPRSSTVHDLLSRRHRIELRNLNAATAFPCIEKSVTNHSPALHEQAAFFDCLRHIGAEIIPFYDVRQKDTAGIILKWCGHFLFRVKVCGFSSHGLESGVPRGLIYRPLA